MSELVAPEIGLQQMDAILRFLPIFERQTHFGEWVTPEGQFPYFSYDAAVSEFVGLLGEHEIMVVFDWPSWSDTAKQYEADSHALATADLLTLRKLLTTHVRADRFTEGHLASVLESGHLTAILRRLKQIRDAL